MRIICLIQTPIAFKQSRAVYSTFWGKIQPVPCPLEATRQSLYLIFHI